MVHHATELEASYYQIFQLTKQALLGALGFSNQRHFIIQAHHPRLCLPGEDRDDVNFEACEGAVKLAAQRMKMYLEDSAIAKELTKTKKSKKAHISIGR